MPFTVLICVKAPGRSGRRKTEGWADKACFKKTSDETSYDKLKRWAKETLQNLFPASCDQQALSDWINTKDIFSSLKERAEGAKLRVRAQLYRFVFRDDRGKCVILSVQRSKSLVRGKPQFKAHTAQLDGSNLDGVIADLEREGFEIRPYSRITIDPDGEDPQGSKVYLLTLSSDLPVRGYFWLPPKCRRDLGAWSDKKPLLPHCLAVLTSAVFEKLFNEMKDYPGNKQEEIWRIIEIFYPWLKKELLANQDKLSSLAVGGKKEHAQCIVFPSMDLNFQYQIDERSTKNFHTKVFFHANPQSPFRINLKEPHEAPTNPRVFNPHRSRWLSCQAIEDLERITQYNPAQAKLIAVISYLFFESNRYHPDVLYSGSEKENIHPTKHVLSDKVYVQLRDAVIESVQPAFFQRLQSRAGWACVAELVLGNRSLGEVDITMRGGEAICYPVFDRSEQTVKRQVFQPLSTPPSMTNLHRSSSCPLPSNSPTTNSPKRERQRSSGHIFFGELARRLSSCVGHPPFTSNAGQNHSDAETESKPLP